MFGLLTERLTVQFILGIYLVAFGAVIGLLGEYLVASIIIGFFFCFLSLGHHYSFAYKEIIILTNVRI